MKRLILILLALAFVLTIVCSSSMACGPQANFANFSSYGSGGCGYSAAYLTPSFVPATGFVGPAFQQAYFVDPRFGFREASFGSNVNINIDRRGFFRRDRVSVQAPGVNVRVRR